MRRRYMGIKSYTPFDTNNYFTIEALDDGLSVVFTKDVEFGIDGIGWQKLLANTNSPRINKGQTISFKASIIPLDWGGIGQFVINKSCNLSGNIMSLLWKGNLASFSFYCLFKDCTTIKSADRLVLPATTLESYCYDGMFYRCTSLTAAPELPATTLVNGCYSSMFYQCIKLNYIEMLATDISAANCLLDWVRGVPSKGTFVKNPAMTSLPTGEDGIPHGWTVVNDGEITFTIDGTEYQAEEGMTWGEWVNSEYNVIGASIYLLDGIGYISVPTGEEGNAKFICNSSYYTVTTTSEIISNYNYNVSSGGGGN